MQNSSGDLASLFQTILKKNGFEGEFSVDLATRRINATDNSIYEVLPAAVAQPQSCADLEELVKLANQEPFAHLQFCARGGGTGTNGQSLTDGIVIDFSRFMTRVLDFDPENQTITVEPGMILSDLNRFLQPYGLFFAPNVSTADRATIGGMIATDAAGKGSLIYGKTADHLLGVKMVLADGRVINTIDTTASKVNEDMVTAITKLLDPVQDEIKERFPPLKRPLSGYNVKQCYQGGEFNLNRLIAGSEGTLGIVGAAKLKLLPIPKFKALIVVHYGSFLEALNDAQFLIQYQPLAIEAIDEKVQKSAQTLPNWPTLAQWLNSVDKNYISNFVEFVADSADELAGKIADIEAALNAKSANFVIIRDNSQINQLWTIRSLAVGLAGKMPGNRKPVAFVEDAIVPPENLASLVADLQAELDKQNLNYAMYGHVDVGCIHVRPALDMQEESDRALIRPITEMLIGLLDKYQGILWGEHGKGYRGEFVPAVFGPVLYPVLCAIKKLFDPHNRFNPGKLTSPDGSPLRRIEKVTMRGELDQLIAKDQQQQFAGAMLCNGNGACFNQEPANVMCPSYKVSRDRIHSPKGRAMLVKEWLREKSQGNSQGAKQAAEAALSAMNGCLGCKGCAGKCPTQVSIPDLRSKFLDSYHQEYRRRNLREWALGRIENILPLIAKVPRLWNFVQHKRLLPSLGIRKIPTFTSTRSLKGDLERFGVGIYSSKAQIVGFAPNPVVIFADVFTGLLNREVLLATIMTLKAGGFAPYVVYPRASGKALIVAGLLEAFKKNSAKLAELINPLLNNNIPVIGLENTVTLLFRDEVTKFAKGFNGKVLTIAEFISSNIDNFKHCKAEGTKHYRILPHCTEQALLPSDSQAWQQIFSAFGHTLEVKNVGCCGMAGTYGHLSENEENSRQLFKMHWENHIRADNITVLATGYSCRSQADSIMEAKIQHPVQVLAELITAKAAKRTSLQHQLNTTHI